MGLVDYRDKGWPHQVTESLSVKATVTNPKGSVEKLSPKESPSDAHTVLRGCPEEHPEVTVFPHCPEDLTQLLRLSKS